MPSTRCWTCCGYNTIRLNGIGYLLIIMPGAFASLYLCAGATVIFTDILGESKWINMAQKKILIIAGPNGAGKSSFAAEFLPHEAGCLTFVNADLIAAGLSPFRPEAAAIRAGRLMLAEMENHVRRGSSFAFETILSGRVYIQTEATFT
jgi:hypothetical protein